MYAFAFRQLIKHRSFILYVLIGGFAAVLDFAAVFLLTSILGVYYIYSAVISFPFATWVHFAMNKSLNFRCRSQKVARQYAMFITLNLTSLGMTIVIMYLLVEYLGMWYLLAKFIAMCIVVFYSFNMNRLITFRVMA